MAARFSGQKRSASSDTSSNSSSGSSATKKRKVSVSTFEKWQNQFDSEYQSLLWLRCTKDDHDKSLVSTLWCTVCREYQARICGMRNYSQTWISGSTNQKTSNILDHARSDQQSSSMAFMRRAQARANNEPIEKYAPMALSLITCIRWTQQ